MSPLFKAIREAAPTLSVGMLTADLLNLGAELAVLESAGVKLVHFDVMDGCFCPMTTIGPPLIKAVKTPLIKDVHLILTLLDIDSFHGGKSARRAGAARGAMRDIGQAPQRTRRADLPHPRGPGEFCRQRRRASLAVSGTTAQRAPDWRQKSPR